MDKNLNVRLRMLCQSLRLDTLQGIAEPEALFIKDAIKNLPSSEEIMAMSENQLNNLRVQTQELQFKLDNSRNERTHDFAIKNMADKNLPPQRAPLLSTSNWYSLYKQASKCRHCFIYKAQDGKWYMELAEKEYGDHYDATTYGPFDSEEEIVGSAGGKCELDHHSNPGGWNTDDSGTAPVPSKSPNGFPVRPPTRRSWSSPGLN